MDAVVRVRLNDNSTVDEVLMADVEFFHLEKMGDDCYWIGLSRGTGHDTRMIHITIHAVKGRKLRVTVSDEGIGVKVTKDGKPASSPDVEVG